MKKLFKNAFKSESAGKIRFMWGRGVLLLLPPVFLLFNMPVFSGDLYQDWRTLTGKQLTAPGDYKCGFPVVLQIANSQNRQLQKLYAERKLSQADLDQAYYSPSGHFKIHYTLSGYDAIPTYDRDGNGTPDYLEFVAKSFDRAWRVEIDSLGFQPPPDSSGSARQVYPINCRRVSVYGSTILDYEIPNLPGLNYVTYIDLNTNFDFVTYAQTSDPIVRDSLAIAVTAAHEFNHALQSGYRLYGDNMGSFEDLWFIESSAVFMEEVVAPDVNDYLQYLPSYFRQVDEPIDNADRFSSIYGRVVLELLLGDHFGKDITRKIWSEIVNQRATPAIEKVLADLGTSFRDELADLAGWLYFSGSRAVSGKFFPDAALFPDLYLEFGAPLQSDQQTLVSDSLPRLSFRWFQSTVQTPLQSETLLKASSNGTAQDFVFLVIQEEPGNYSKASASRAVPVDGSQDMPVLAYGAVNGRLTGEQFLGFDILAKPQGEAAEIYPQPLVLSRGNPFLHFDHLPAEAVIYIFSSNGKYLQTLRTEPNERSVSWNLLTKDGEMAGSGVYLYRIKSPGKEKTGKFVLVR